MSRAVRRALLIPLVACASWYGAAPAAATLVCAEHPVVGRLCVQPYGHEPVTCEQTGALATCDLLEDPCHNLSVCQVCPTGDPCVPPADER